MKLSFVANQFKLFSSIGILSFIFFLVYDKIFFENTYWLFSSIVSAFVVSLSAFVGTNLNVVAYSKGEKLILIEILVRFPLSIITSIIIFIIYYIITKNWLSSDYYLVLNYRVLLLSFCSSFFIGAIISYKFPYSD